MDYNHDIIKFIIFRRTYKRVIKILNFYLQGKNMCIFYQDDASKYFIWISYQEYYSELQKLREEKLNNVLE